MATIAVDFDGTIVTHEYPKIGTVVVGIAIVAVAIVAIAAILAVSSIFAI